MAQQAMPIYRYNQPSTSDGAQNTSWRNPTANTLEYKPITMGTTSPYQGSTGTSGLSGSNTGGSATYYSNAPTIGTGNTKTGAPLNNAPATYGGNTSQAMTTQPVGPTTRSSSSDVITPPTDNNFPSGPSGQTGQQTAYQIPGSQVAGGNAYSTSLPDWITGASRESWADPKFAQGVQAYMATLASNQLGQNAYQYTNDFNEAQRRWDSQFGWTQQNDQFNQNMAGRQQTQAEKVAEWAQENSQRDFGLNQELGRGNLAVAQMQNQIDEMYKKGQLTNEQYSNETQRIQAANQLHLGNAQNQISQQNADTQRASVNNQLHLGNREADIKDWYNRQQVGLAQQQNTIDNMWKSGQLTNQQRELALGELTQKQNEAFRYANMSQEAALTRENYANQQKVAAMNAFGRAQAPRSRWVRSW